MTHMVISAVIHGVIFDILWRTLGRLPLPLAIAAGAVVIGSIMLVRIALRPRRRWR